MTRSAVSTGGAALGADSLVTACYSVVGKGAAGWAWNGRVGGVSGGVSEGVSATLWGEFPPQRSPRSFTPPFGS
jgi:hypothetical protein